MIYLGTTVLTEDPNRRDTPTHTQVLSKTRQVNTTGPFNEIVKGGSIQQLRPFSWFLGSRADVTTFETFRDTNKGRLGRFWVPTWQHDLLLITNVTAGASVIPLRNMGYTKYFWSPTKKFRRYLALIKMGQGIVYLRRIDSAVEDTALQETITLDTAVPVNMTVGEWMLSFLTMCRLDSDTVRTHWHSPTLAEAELTFRELPLEVP